jgi:hypothetical protein
MPLCRPGPGAGPTSERGQNKIRLNFATGLRYRPVACDPDLKR